MTALMVLSRFEEELCVSSAMRTYSACVMRPDAWACTTSIYRVRVLHMIWKAGKDLCRMLYTNCVTVYIATDWKNCFLCAVVSWNMPAASESSTYLVLLDVQWRDNIYLGARPCWVRADKSRVIVKVYDCYVIRSTWNRNVCLSAESNGKVM